MYRWFRDNGLPEGFQVLCLSCDDSKGTGGRCTLALIDSKKRCYACNEIKLLVKDFGPDRTARDGHARAARRDTAARAMRRIAKCRRVT